MEQAKTKLQSLLNLWNEKRASREMPSRADLAVQALRPWLGNLALIDLRDSDGPIFRLCGTSLYSRFGGEMTRRKIGSLDDDVAKTLRQSIEQVCHTRKPAQAKHETAQGQPIVFHELCAPLSDNGVTIDTVLFASYAEQRR
jgi:hypothetical protein